MGAAGGLLAILAIVFQLTVTVILVYLAWRFVEAAERIAHAYEKIARAKTVTKPPEAS
ncbi:MAG: hypothetical protein K2Y21_05205 [Phycisphaerales bacterium]|nr:hypothetical protein [Phycisphaerales bacterium]